MGKRFAERTKTTTVSRYGCCLPLPRLLQPDQPIQMRRIGTNEIAVARVVAPMGLQADGRLYGVETRDSCEGLWGIRFSSAFYEKLLDNMQADVSRLDRERKISYWNGGGGGRAEHCAGEALGQEYGESMMAMVDDAGKGLSHDRYSPDSVMLDVMQDKEKGKDQEKEKESPVTEFYIRHQRGHRIPVSVRELSIRNSAGNIVGAVEVFGNSPVRLKFQRRVSELEQLAFRDALTGLPNRRHIELRVEQGLQDHQRQGRLYGLLMFDIDCFKQVNDTHGHDAADAMLKTIGESVARGLRSSDILGRWGGEVFLVLAPDVNAVALGDLAERCRILIAQSSVAAASARVSVTASIGATVLIHSDSANSVIRRADELMFQSKHSGGDRTTAG